MTTESQKAFDEWWEKPSSELAGHKATAFNAWQASEARIRAMLESEEMREKLTEIVEMQLGSDENGCDHIAKAALKAIVDGI